ncbi:MAG: undecaprenyl-diphosphate phosphatase [Candidatus Caldarchaeum sp.]|nr:undecaprenyl-diphosphate phosphatase [Candidatus Caldarchaeum sp.]
MDFSEAVLLGLLQGFAEWLPVSSEGLVSLVSKLVFGRNVETALASAIWLHVGTLFSALLYLRREVWLVVRGFVEEGRGRRLLIFLLVATAGSAATALPVLLAFRQVMVSDWLFTASVGLFLILTGLVPRKPLFSGVDENIKTGILVGLIQGFSIIPGVSRSGVTISALLLLGAPVHEAFRLSYLMSIPVVAGAQVLLPLLLEVNTFTGEMLVGAAASFVAGLLTMKLLLTASAKLNPRLLMIPMGCLIFSLGLSMAI